MNLERLSDSIKYPWSVGVKRRMALADSRPRDYTEWCFMKDVAATDHPDEIATILDAAPFPLVISRVSDGTVLYANDRLATLVGLTAEELIGNRTPAFYADPEDRKALLAELEKAGRVMDYELRLLDVGQHHF